MKKLFLLSVFALLTSYLSAQLHWAPVDPAGSTGFTATIIGVVELDGDEQHSSQLEVGVFNGDVCRGTGMSSTVALNRNLVFISVFGLSGEQDSFKIYDHATNTELDASCSQTFVYQDNGQTGTIPSPYVISFESNHFVINVSADPTAGGTVTGGGTYDKNAPVTLIATPSTGYSFVNWTKDNVEVSTNLSYSFTATASTAGDYVAHFKAMPCVVTATANPTEGGTVTGANTYDYGTSVTLVATPATGYHFVNWTLNGTPVYDNPSYTFVVEGDVDYVANFAINNYAITAVADPTEGGVVSGAGNYDHFATCTLTATANTGYTFVNWTKGGVEVSTNTTISFAVEEAADYVAHFELNSYEITATADPVKGGTITGAGTYNHFATCELTATASIGYTFVNWTKGGVEVSTNTTFSFTVEEAADYVAHFSLNSYEITATADPTTGGTVTGAGNYDHFATCTLIATANTGYHFVKWTESGQDVPGSDTLTFEVSGARNLVANFEINNYTITAVADPTAGGVVTGAGNYDHFATCTLTATANTGYTFVNWTKGGVEVSTNTTISFEVVEAADYVAHFNLNSYEITATADPTEGGTIAGAGTYNHFETCELTATANTGYTFVNWTKGGVEVSTNTTFSFTVEEAADYVAHFSLNSYEITATADPAEGGSVTGAGTYNHFATCTLIATANTGYHFVKWTESGQDVVGSDTLTFEVTGARDLVAHFELNSYEITATADPTEGGTIAGAGTYNHFAICEMTATANTGYTFVNWTKGGVEVSTNTTFSFTVEEAADYVAHFSLNSYEITATADPTTGGTVTGAGNYDHFATCTLIATANTGYHFVKWTESGQDVLGSDTLTFEVTGARTLIAHFELNSYEITATADPVEGGTITGAGSYNHFETCTLVATAATGYHFVKWTEGGQDVVTSDTLTFEVTGARDFVALFELNSYEIATTVNPAVGGTVSGAGTYNHFATCTLTATPATGYHFVNWTVGGNAVSTSATYSFEVNGAATYTANFEINNYAITAVADPTAGGVVTGGGNYDHFATCTLTATANTGFTFVNWTKGGVEVSTDTTFSFTVEEAADYVAHFNPNSYAITATADPTEGGTIAGAGTYNHFETCELTATANMGYTFVNWTKGGAEVSTNTTISFEVVEAADYVAHFSLNSYEITATADPAEGGSVTGAGNYDHFATCTLIATANTGYHFVKWTESGQDVLGSDTLTFEVTGARTLVAHFELDSYEITATADPVEGGTITGAGTYNHFETCTLVATAATGYHFVKWTEGGQDVVTSDTLTFEVTGARDFVALFELNSYEIATTVNPAVGGTVSGAGTYNHFATCTLTATPATGYHFVNWTVGGNAVSTSATYSFEVNGAATYTANFEINNYAITAVADPTAGGVVTGAGNYDHFATCTLTATANTGYTFVNWTKGGVEVSTNTTISFTVEEAADYVAHFNLNSYTITAAANPAAGGSVSGAGTYNYSATCVLVATAATGYHFVNWTKNGTVVSTSSSYSFTVEEAASFVAHFEINSYAITATANPAEGGTVTGAGTYNHASTCTLTATASETYIFVNWTRNGVEVSTSPTYTFTVTGAGDYVANFTLGYVDIMAYSVPANYGAVSGDGNYLVGTTCTLSATPYEGYFFVEWTKGSEVVSTDAVFSFVVTEAATYKAHFNQITYSITAEANPEEGGTVTGTSDLFHINTTCQLVARANEGYSFVNWTKNGEVVSTYYIYEFVVTESAHFVANFVYNTYEITATADPEEGGSIVGAGSYDHGETVTLTAIPNNDYEFVHWTEDGEIVSEEAVYTFTATQSRHLVAHFHSTVGVDELDEFSVSMYPNPTVDKLMIVSRIPVLKCEVFSLTGQRLIHLEGCGEMFEIQVQDLAAGSYMIRMTSGDFVKSMRFIKE